MLTRSGNTIVLISFLLAEIPSQLVSKKLGPDRWIPFQMVAWSIVAASQAAMTDKSGFYACRALLGLLEGGFIPDMVLWLSYFYTGGELPLRLSFFWTSLNVTGIATSLLAFALLHLDGVHHLAGWRWLFLIVCVTERSSLAIKPMLTVLTGRDYHSVRRNRCILLDAVVRSRNEDMVPSQRMVHRS